MKGGMGPFPGNVRNQADGGTCGAMAKQKLKNENGKIHRLGAGLLLGVRNSRFAEGLLTSIPKSRFLAGGNSGPKKTQLRCGRISQICRGS